MALSPKPNVADASQAKWVLVTEGGAGHSRAAVSAVRILAAEGYRTTVTVSSDISLAAASKYCTRTVRVPCVDEEPTEYASAIRSELERLPYIAVLPASDPALVALDFPVTHLLDKIECARIAQRAGLQTPPSILFDSASKVMENGNIFEYPIVVKPNTKRAPAARVRSIRDLRTRLAPLLANDGPVIVQPYVGENLHGILGLVWNGTIVSAMHMRYHRVFPYPCGTVASAETIECDRELESKLELILSGYNGLFHADLAGPYLLDLNPRIHATLPLACHAGINPLASYCALLSGKAVQKEHAQPGIYFRWIEGDIRTGIRRLQLGTARLTTVLKELMPRRGTIHSYESLQDPGPMFERFGYLARRVAARILGMSTSNSSA
jgi:hypothetical protein